MNKELFEQLKQELIKHHIDCEGNACTSHPVFCVQTKKVIWGIDSEYDYDVTSLYDNCNSESYDSLLDYLKAQDDDFDKEYLERVCDYLGEESAVWESCYEVVANELENHSWHTESDITEFLNDLGLEVHSCYGKTVYEDVDFLLTRTAAEEYIENWSYKLNSPRIYVKSMWQNDYMRSFIKSIMEGEIVWKE
tara:strand:- start:5643 stop:6221 length:579 start_codon:yes stop_codon:yes gene_type:complete